jgi:hypothetical protein
MATARDVIREPFQHQLPRQDGTEIRVLELLPKGEFGDETRSDLNHVDLPRNEGIGEELGRTCSIDAGVMAKIPCPTCHRSEGDLHPRVEKTESREVSLASIHNAALGCNLCSFVQQLLAQDLTTPNKCHSSYDSAKVRVDDDGLRFTGQWQGALVIEIYTPSKFHLLILGETV